MGIWQRLSNPPPWQYAIGQMLLLPDGRVLVNALENGSMWGTTWLTLSPDSSGQYAKGTWAKVASNRVARNAFPAVVLRDGCVLIAGGEYWRDPAGALRQYGSEVELYHPVLDKWIDQAPLPSSPDCIGNAPMTRLAGDDVLVGCGHPGCWIFHKPPLETQGFWRKAAAKVNTQESSCEQAWVKMTDGGVLTIDAVVSSFPGAAMQAERYFPGDLGTWRKTSPPPFNFIHGWSMFGPGVLLPDGRVWWIGGQPKSLFYSPVNDTWSPGPDLPQGATSYNGMAVVLPNGKVLFATNPNAAANPTWMAGPVSLYEFDPAAKTFANVTPPAAVASVQGSMSAMHMLLLPTGQVLFSNNNALVLDAGALSLYTPDPPSSTAWRPDLRSIIREFNGKDADRFVLNGNGFSGFGEGTFGCGCAQAATDYPLVLLIDSAARCTYARSFDWSRISVRVEVPDGFKPAAAAVIVNGVGSVPLSWPGP